MDVDECSICYEEFVNEDGESTSCSFRGASEEEWKVSNVCWLCVERMINDGWKHYLDQLDKATCAAEMRRLLTAGPPTHLRDTKAFPVANENGQVHEFKLASGLIVSAKLKGALDGQERLDWWQEKKNLIEHLEQEEHKKEQQQQQ